MSSNNYFIGKMFVAHNSLEDLKKRRHIKEKHKEEDPNCCCENTDTSFKGDALTCFCFNSDRTALVTADSAGRIMLRDVSETNWLKDGNRYAETMKIKWFIQAHRSTINSIKIVETFREEPDSD